MSVVVSYVIALWGAGLGVIYTATTLAGPARLGNSPYQRRYPIHIHQA